MKSILFRADGNDKLGLGHIVRCLALADELKKYLDLEVKFITKYEEGKKNIEEKNYNVTLVEDDELSQISNLTTGDTLLVTDFLNTDNRYISEIRRKTGLKVVCIDNNTKLKRIDADIVINANVFDKGETKVIGTTRYFWGPKYMVLRKEFEEAFKEKKKLIVEVKEILVMFGGTDPKGYTLKVADALKKLQNSVHITLILGPGFSYSNKLDEIISEDGKFDVFSDPRNLIKLMKKADMAITAAGITLYELAALGVPSIAVPQAKHQEDIAKAFEIFGACINIGVSPDNKQIYKSTIRVMGDDSLRRQLSENAPKFVDGKGAERVIKLLKSEIPNEI